MPSLGAVPIKLKELPGSCGLYFSDVLLDPWKLYSLNIHKFTT
jgi:hypothetical protein